MNRLINKGRIGKLCLLAFGSVVAIVVAEGVIRVFDLVPETDQSNVRAVVDSSGAYKKFKPNLRAVPYGGMLLTTNRFGYRSPAMHIEKSGAFRIAVLGDSWGFGWGVQDGQTIVERLSERLRYTCAPADLEVFNFSCPGYGMPDHFLVFKHEVLSFEPDFCLVLVHVNDAGYFETRPETPHSDEVHERPVRSVRRFLTSLKLSKFVYAYLLLPVAIELELPNKSYPNLVASWYAEGSESRRLYEESAEQLTALLREQDVPTSFYLLPIPMSQKTPYPMQPINNIVKQIFAKYGVEVHELLDSYSKRTKDELILNAFDRHPNAFASELLAEEIEQRLADDPVFFGALRQYQATR